MPAKKKTMVQEFPGVRKFLPGGDTFHDQKGPIIWITKKHLLKIESYLQLMEKLKETTIESAKRFKKIDQL